MQPAPSPAHARIPASIACGAYVLLALVQTWPLALHPLSRLPAGTIDVWSNHWNFWWWKHCLWGIRANPFHSDLLFYPAGTDVIFHTHSIFNMFLSAPVNLMFGEVAAYNFCILFAVAMAGFFAFLLVRDILADDRAAFVAGLVYAFMPQRMEFVMENLNLLSSEFIPLAILLMRRVARSGGTPAICGLGVTYALNALCDWHLGLELSVALTGIAGYYLCTRPRPYPHLLRDWTLAALAAFVLLSPAVLPMLRAILSDEGYFQKLQDNKGIDPTFLFIPHFQQPIWGRFFAEIYREYALFAAPGFGCFLGFTPIILALIACRRSPYAGWKWALLFVVSILFALGAHPRIAGQTLSSMTLPFALLEHVPIFSMMRVANRFYVLAALAWALLAAIGTAAILRQSNRTWTAVCIAILIEFAWLPLPTQPVPEMIGFRKAVLSSPEGAVLDLPQPPGIRQTFNMTGQTIHERAIAGGYLSTTPKPAADYFLNEPALADLVGIDPPLQRPIDVDRLRILGFGLIVLHRDRTTGLARLIEPPRGEHDLYRRKIAGYRSGWSAEKFRLVHTDLAKLLGPPIFEDEDLSVFKLK